MLVLCAEGSGLASSAAVHSYPAKPGEPNMVNSANPGTSVNWYQMSQDTSNCNMTGNMLGENMMADGTAANSTDSMDTDTSQLFAATYQVLEGEEDELLSANQHNFYDAKLQGGQPTSTTQMNQANFPNSVGNQLAPHNMPPTSSTGMTQNYNSKPGSHPPQSSVPSKHSEPPKLAHPGPPIGHRQPQPPYPGMWPNQSRPQTPPQNRPVGNMAPYGSPVPSKIISYELSSEK